MISLLITLYLLFVILTDKDFLNFLFQLALCIGIIIFLAYLFFHWLGIL